MGARMYRTKELLERDEALKKALFGKRGWDLA